MGRSSRVKSDLGEVDLDCSGSPVAVVRMDTESALGQVPTLLQQYINSSDDAAWAEIRRRIDYVFENLDIALGGLHDATRFGEKVRSEIAAGRRLLFKPNLVIPMAIDPDTHGPGLSLFAVTNWPFVAALMRWFHDRLSVSYHRMALGEGATVMSATAARRSRDLGQDVPTTAIIEGRYGDQYGGWGFHFVRKYLADSHGSLHTDDPMHGYEESISGTYLPPGDAGARLMVYDLNRIPDASIGRDVPVPGGDNFKEITLHKVVVGGDPDDAEDRRAYPGCVLVNVPRTRMHGIDLFTNALKNIGIGLYPMEVTEDRAPRSTQWKYAVPARPVPGMKALLPHAVWVGQRDETGMPLRDESGQYAVTRTAGMKGTQADVILATMNQGVFMLHVADGLSLMASLGPVPEGLAFASLDPVALDLASARYLFKTVPMREAREAQQEMGLATDFLQPAAVPGIDGGSIVSRDSGYDSPLPRYPAFEYMERRGVGQKQYHILGHDSMVDAPLASVGGHLGRVRDGVFSELATTHFYHSMLTPLWYLQKTFLSYLAANDQLTGSDYHQQVLDAFDENGDGQIDFDEMGRNGHWNFYISIGGGTTHSGAVEEHGSLSGPFRTASLGLKLLNRDWNAQGHDIFKAHHISLVCGTAYGMSQSPVESPDPLFPAMTWGKGRWPSFQFAERQLLLGRVYGPGGSIGLQSLFGLAFQYADRTLNNSAYTGGPSTGPVEAYLAAVAKGSTRLDFVLYVPGGYGPLDGRALPNVVETDDPAKVFTASFKEGLETWPGPLPV